MNNHVFNTNLDNFLKAFRPDRFDGRVRDARAEDWLVAFDRYCDVAKIPKTGSARVQCAALLMIGDASRWYSEIESDLDDPSNKDEPYETFKTKFRERFVKTFDADDAFDQLRRLTQARRSVTDYSNEFLRLRTRIKDLDKKTACRLYKGGLNPDIRQFLENHPSIAEGNLNGLISLAERLDRTPRNERYHHRPLFNHHHQRQHHQQHQPQQQPRHTSLTDSYPQPMELDAIQRSYNNSQSRFQQSISKEEQKKNDFTKGQCFYCHKTGHLIGDCPARAKKNSGKVSAQ